ncbi:MULTISPECIES: hypothetical protein [unclassified Candidatus Frackibacter]|uniref:hypothetical protein n=1 Tax=unclassified Candidatus Frackibacter TaxID=2648818 RepID=UPI0008822525|nr:MULTISPECIES: hypothetical protein [unclassified Candidatus Frackibacter]SDC55134.1 hypothetical protein SAMN04515661_11375 [Candidatus Frackibacter sp. WG11]SEM67220.1 hypothetical protein SAMN04488698_11175 [Candidatus Frackibacter sp. WG12]SFL78489.1 hypothetical protein SAMN04488699_11375 [Candidatus Frackibacter sp. WG13]
MDKINELIQKYRNKIMQIKNVVGVGCGYKETNGKNTDKKAMVILVKEKLDKDELGRRHVIPEEVEEVVTDVVEVGDLELHSPRQTRRGRVSRTARVRPAQPGVSIGHYKVSAGTFGAVVKDSKTKEPLILSNNHVLANLTSGHDDRSEIGDPVLQPGRHDGGEEGKDTIGHLERFVPIKRKSATSSCLIAQGFENILNGIAELVKFPYQIRFLRNSEKANIVDCAVAKPVDPDKIVDKVLQLGRIEGVVEPEVGMRIVKSGRTSGITRAKIKAINATVEVNVSAAERAVFDDQIIAEPFSKPGDSGSLVLDTNNRAVGLLFAGSSKSTICNRITNVMDKLGVEML